MIGTLLARNALRGAFDALNHHDLQKFMSSWHNDGGFIYPGDVWASGKFEGKKAVAGWFQRFFEQFPEITFEIQNLGVRNLFDFLGNNTVTVHWLVKLTNRSGRVGQNSGVTVVRIEHGKVHLVQDFIFDLGDNFRLNWAQK